MKIIWITPLLLIQSYRTIGSHLNDEYNQQSFFHRKPLSPRPLDAMADLTNDLGVCVLRVIAGGGAIGNIAFSPFGLMAVSVLLYEGSSGYSALQIKQSLNLPWEILAVRIGVRDLNRYLKTYFKSDGFLNGLTMSREEVCLRPQFKRVLRLYGFDDPNSFLIDSCPESPLPITTAAAAATTTTTTTTRQPMPVAAHGTVVTEMTPTSQSIQVSTNITNNGSASEISTVTTDLPAKVTYVGDASFTISNIDTNTNQPMNLQTDTMVVDIETQPHIRPIESTTEQFDTKFLIGEQELKSTNTIEVTDTNPNEFFVTETIITSTSVITSTDPLIETNTIMQTNEENSSSVNSSQINKLIDKTNNIETRSSTTETATSRLHESTTDAISLSSNATTFNANEETILPSDSYATSMKNKSDISVTSTENTLKINLNIDFNDPNKVNGIDASMFTTNNVITDLYETTLNIGTDSTAEIISSTKRMPTGDGYTAAIEMNTISAKVSDQPTSTVKSELSDDGITMENVALTTDPSLMPVTSSNLVEIEAIKEAIEMNTISAKVSDQPTPTVKSELSDDGITIENVALTTDPSLMAITSSNLVETEVIKEAESNQHYQIASVENKNARSMESSDNLPTFNIEFVVTKKDLQANCNHTRKITFIKPERILTEYPENSGISIGLRNSKKRRKRYLEQYHGYNTNRNQWLNGFKTYGPPGWIDRSDPFESANLFNAGYRRIPFFTYTAVLPYGFIVELKSQVIEIPLDDPKYTLMILMPNHPDGLSELLLLLPTMSLRNIHNSLKPTAIHATIPTFKYTAKVDLTSALQEIGIRDVFYRYRADLSFMSPDARLFVSSVQQVVSVTAKKYNTPPIYEIQRKYVENEFILSKPFAYFVMDVHTKVSLIAGIITDPLASPIWN